MNQKVFNHISPFMLFALLSGHTAAETELPVMSDFNHGTQLTTAEAPVRRFLFKPDITKNILRRDLGDIRIFDSNNNLIPVQVNRLNKSDSFKTKRLSFLPHQQAGKVTSYIIDRSSNHKPWLRELKLSWKQKTGSSAATVSVEHSADLKNWETINSSTVASNFRFGDTMIKHNYVEINDFTERYIKLAFLKRRHIQPVLQTVSAIVTYGKPMQQQWVQVSKLKPVANQPKRFQFNLYGGITPNNIKLNFSKLNSVIMGSLHAITNINGKDKYARISNDFDNYKLTFNNQVVRSKPINISKWKINKWMVDVDVAQNINKNNLPGVLVEYPAYEITFPAESEDPYTLVWGNENAGKPASHPTWPEDDAQQVHLSRLLNKTQLAELMESQSTPWIAILIMLIVFVLVGVGGAVGFKRSRKED